MSIISILKKKNKKYLFTTPSHDGTLCILHKFYQWYRNDISEVDAYNPEEALVRAEEFATKVYKTKNTHFLTNGSSSGIIASVLACCDPNDTVLIWDKAHRCHNNACKLANTNIITYELPFNEEWGIYEKLTPQKVEYLLSQYSAKAIIVTSPSYEGIVSDIKTIKNICEKHNTYLIVDEAHGALYPFSDNLPQSAVNIADFCIQSLHKTAGGINPTALLHNNTNLDVQKALNLITTTSPSYPMLATIEANIKFLNSSKGKKKIEKLISEIKNIKKQLINLEFYGDDITKILIKSNKYSGYELSEILFEKFNIEDEKTNEKSTILLTGLGTTKNKLSQLRKLKKI